MPFLLAHSRLLFPLFALPENTPRVPGVTPKYNWTFPSMLTIAREEGASALYKGFTPKVLRLAPGGGVLLLVVEVVLEQWRRVLGGEYAA